MKTDAAFEALKRANPEPDPTALRKALAETTVTVVDDTKTRQRPNRSIPTKSRPRPLWRPAFSAGLVVLMVVAAMVIPWTGRQSILDRIRTSPVEIASGYMEARNTFDAAAAGELLAPDASLRDVLRMDRGELELGFEALRIYGWQFESFECENTPGATLVTCSYLLDTRLSQITGYRLVEGRIHFLVKDGEITSLVHDFNMDVYAPSVHEPYFAWLNQEHPGAVEQLFVVRDGIQTPILTEESLALARTYLDEYDLSLNG